MRFEEFAYEHGLVIDNLSLDKWMRVKTLDKPNKLNGAYVFDGQGIVKSGLPSTHPYLIRKGFTERGLVWKELLVVSMRVGSQLVGCQLIDKDGNKKFLSGQITKGASLVIDNKGRDILVEGYATGLSVRRALKLMKARYKIHICFSASNMLEIAKTLNEPLVVADNDPVGLSTAQKIASCYWVGDAGEDFNDFEVRVGSLVAGESLVSLL